MAISDFVSEPSSTVITDITEVKQSAQQHDFELKVKIVVEPVPASHFGCIEEGFEPFGAVVKFVDAEKDDGVSLPSELFDISKISDDQFEILKQALFNYYVVVIPNQRNISPHSQYLVTKRFDPTILDEEKHKHEERDDHSYGHAKEFRHEKSVLRKDGHAVPTQPQVQILGQGTFMDLYDEMPTLSLTHPTFSTFHKSMLSDEQLANNKTKYYRWHIDSALYDLAPPVVTTLLAIHVPDNASKRQKIITDVAADQASPTTYVESSQASTCFFSGTNAYAALTAEEKTFAKNTIVVYAPHPYIFISKCKATDDGFTIVSEGNELEIGDGKEESPNSVPKWEDSKLKRLPLVWTNPVTGRNHLQAHGCCVLRLETYDGPVTKENIESGKLKLVNSLSLEESRSKLHSLFGRSIAPGRILHHDWQKGDLVIFYNRGVSHSVTGQFKAGESRMMHQCNLASKVDPQITNLDQ
eukprot:CAMPEP_0175048854 /NCGR_PEP_ID=MMETSP0052_2-20121109/6423_1 /TAXON_ID=51329 ORGANISM="Polytomella parva, Strain SAG 63-3" /NCGR_SAMPLE_ID=MMETSP0052_2 /ASSEMBLY_ACC=CAM_ASM_000194 /LENGTH=468 /DNA_ID=CAMNT_0016312969 /DNA_START=35 /DNA_END=1441 /DNA_ORIENTATION=+